MKANFFKGNRRTLREKAKVSLLVIAANGQMQRNGDNVYPFRQDSSFWYLTGIEEPDLLLVFDGKEEFLILPPRDEIRNIFDGHVNKQSLRETSGIRTILDAEAGWDRLLRLTKKRRRAGVLMPLPRFVEHYDFFSNPARSRLNDRLLAANKNLAFTDLRSAVAEQRVIKQPEELVCLQKAIDITSETILDVKKNINTYKYEYEIEAAITLGFRSRGAQGHAFSPIVASGKNTGLVHSFLNNARIEKNSILLLDIGAEVSNYSADISRILAVGKPGKRQQQIFDAVHRAQMYALSLLKPGINYYEFEVAVEEYMGTELKTLGLIKSTTRKSIRKYFPHAASHFLGLETHDVGDRRQDLRPGMVLAIEPGIIIAKEGIGMRVEENVLITEKGCKVLTKHLPTDL